MIKLLILAILIGTNVLYLVLINNMSISHFNEVKVLNETIDSLKNLLDNANGVIGTQDNIIELNELLVVGYKAAISEYERVEKNDC